MPRMQILKESCGSIASGEQHNPFALLPNPPLQSDERVGRFAPSPVRR